MRQQNTATDHPHTTLQMSTENQPIHHVECTVQSSFFSPISNRHVHRPSLLRDPLCDSDKSSVTHRNNAKKHHANIESLLAAGLSNALIVEERRVDVDERYASSRTNNGNELVQIGGANDSDNTTQAHGASAQHVLLPLDRGGALASCLLTEQRGLDDTDSREELDGVAGKDGERVEELHRVDKLGVLREVGDDLDLGELAEGGVAEGANGGEDDGDDEHDEVEQLGEVLRLLHAGLNGQDEANAFEGENRAANGERESGRAEELDALVDSEFGQAADVVLPDVDHTDQDEDVGKKGGRSKFGDVADQCQRDQKNELQGNERVDANR
jgi:hypothetical protein